MWALAKMGFTLNAEGTTAFLHLLRARLPAPAATSPAGTPPPPASALPAHQPRSHALPLPACAPARGSAPAPPYPLSAQELSNVVYALARFGRTPSADLTQDLLVALQQCLTADAGVPVAAAAPGLPGRGRGEHSSGGSSSRRGVHAGGDALNAQELSNVLWSLAKLGVQPSEAWLADFWAAVQRQIRCGRRRGAC